MLIATLSTWKEWSYIFILLSVVEGWGMRKIGVYSSFAQNQPSKSLQHSFNNRLNAKDSSFCLMSTNDDACPQSSVTSSRKLFLRYLQSVIAIGLVAPTKALAARGAFEMDAEFYIQNAFGVRKEKDPSFFKNGVIFPSPRKLNTTFASSIAAIVFEELSKAMDVSIEAFKANLYGKVPYYLKYFKTFAPIVTESLDDQYYFDMIMYIAYLEAGSVVKHSQDRVQLRQRIGDRILAYLQATNKFSTPSTASPSTKAILAANLVNRRGDIKLLLDAFVAAKFISEYKYDDEPLDDVPYVLSSFDEVKSTLIITLTCFFMPDLLIESAG